jgi:hypothetical protein
VTAQIKAELLKVRSTRTTVGLLVGMIALTLLFVILSGLRPPPTRSPLSATSSTCSATAAR